MRTDVTSIIITAIAALVAVSLTAIGMLVRVATKWGALDARVEALASRIETVSVDTANDRSEIKQALVQINDRVWTILSSSILEREK